MATKDWSNVYVLRQEYNKFQKKWFPIVIYWNVSDSKSWTEALCTEDGTSFYHDEIKTYFTSVTRKGTDKCDPKDVERIIEEYKSENSEPVFEVQQLGRYVPIYKRG